MAASRQFLKKGRALRRKLGPPDGGGLYRRVVFADAQGEGGGFAAVFSPLPQEGGVAVRRRRIGAWIRRQMSDVRLRYVLAFPLLKSR